MGIYDWWNKKEAKEEKKEIQRDSDFSSFTLVTDFI